MKLIKPTLKIGQIGKGSFGKKILSKLNNIDNISIEWICGSQDKWWDCSNVDWVIIASPNQFHYEQAKFFLENNTNVFCEKPGTLNSESLAELIQISKDNSLRFYIDDVLIYENLLPQDNFIYKKWGGNSGNLIDRMGYHHFYLIYDKLKNTNNKVPTSISVIKNKTNHKIFELYFNNSKFKFEYNFDWFRKKVHNIKSQSSEDALQKMLSVVLSEKANFNLNLERSLFATKISEYVKTNLYGKCLVVGAGIYGITAAIKLKSIGYEVDLFEAKDDILKAASGINQYRVHRGYHYPRSLETIKSCKNNEPSFIKYYNQAILDNGTKHYYSIAKEESLVSANEYLSVLDKAGLEWKIVESLPNCDLTIEVNEKLYDPYLLKEICNSRIKGNGINLKLNNKVTSITSDKYKYSINATYSALNRLDNKKQDYQFELCEKPLFKLPNKYKNKSIVIMDGPFMCFDPFSNTEYHLGGNVVHAIHIRNVGKYPEIPKAYKEWLNRGIIKNPKFTNVDRFIQSAKKFFPDIENAEHIGSMFTIRTVLPNKDKTDERPSIVTRDKNNFILFSGKIGNCIESANTIEEIIKA